MNAERRRIVVGVDGSDPSHRALAWAIDEAGRWGSEVEAVHAWSVPFSVIPPPLALTYDVDLEAAERMARHILDSSVDGTPTPEGSHVHIERILVQDNPARALLEVSKNADLLVVGSRGRGGFAGLLLGSVTSQCTHHAPCPVVVVR